MRENEHIKRLLVKHLHEDLSVAEWAQLDAWADCHPAYRQLVDHYRSGQFTGDLKEFHEASDANAIEETLTYILSKQDTAVRTMQVDKPVRGFARRWLPYAAAILAVGLIAVGLYVGLMPQTGSTDIESQAAHILPGGNRAVLTLADGRSVFLSETANGIVIGDSQITYSNGDTVGQSAFGMLSLKTPKGGTYQITLPDGSKVWLNAATILTYPSRFDEKERVVELEGEAYFEVTSRIDQKGSGKKKIPFLVKSKGQTVEVLGTQFNVSAYAQDANMQTTLVEGAVRVRVASASAGTKINETILKPGQQAMAQGSVITTREVVTEPYTAWKNGEFMFNSEPLESIMMKLSRWYDVEVVFADEVLKRRTFLGSISRYEPLSEVLQLLEATGSVRFRVDGREVHIEHPAINGSQR